MTSAKGTHRESTSGSGRLLSPAISISVKDAVPEPMALGDVLAFHELTRVFSLFGHFCRSFRPKQAS